MSPRGLLYRQDSQGDHAGRPASRAADQIRTRYQPQDRQRTRPRRAADAARSCRRGDRVKLPRRRFLHLAASAAAVPTLPRIAQAEAYPTRPVRIIVGFAPGQATDIVTRIIGQWLSEQLGQQFIIENRPGAGGNIATEAVVRAPPIV